MSCIDEYLRKALRFSEMANRETDPARQIELDRLAGLYLDLAERDDRCAVEIIDEANEPFDRRVDLKTRPSDNSIWLARS